VKDATCLSEIETARVLSEYKRLVLLGRARLPFAEARRIVGPDCAYHLYFRHARTGRPPASAATSTRRRKRRKA
jgi:hypothetical protein